MYVCTELAHILSDKNQNNVKWLAHLCVLRNKFPAIKGHLKFLGNKWFFRKSGFYVLNHTFKSLPHRLLHDWEYFL